MTSAALTSKSGSSLARYRSKRCGLRRAFVKMRCTLDLLIPKALANLRHDQWVLPSFGSAARAAPPAPAPRRSPDGVGCPDDALPVRSVDPARSAARSTTVMACWVVKSTTSPRTRSSPVLPFRLMAKRDSPASRRRGKSRLGRKTFVYFTDDEGKLIDQASKLERRSISSFVANAAIAAAEEVVSLSHRKRTRK
jgi:hypothetical protein